MKKTKIDWCDSTWNPVTGCLHGCEYCYARRIAERFGWKTDADKLHDVHAPQKNSIGNICPYPFGFAPTFLHYKLKEPARWTKPRTIFVCSMADLFGAWVPDEWILAVFDACRAAPQHRYLFLTKNPDRYIELKKRGLLPVGIDCWYGSSRTRPTDDYNIGFKSFISVEPILESFEDVHKISCSWVIIGAETGNRKNKIIPKKEWILPFAEMCRESGVPVFMKESLREIMGADFRQEFPWYTD